jgi:putative peptide zinc metalloprotease protein
VRRQYFRGQRWIVLENDLNNTFFRIRPEAYEFIARLRPDRTVEEAWKQCLDRFPDQAPGQEAVIQLLAQLYHASLLQYNVATDTARLFERFEKTTQRENRSRWLNIMFLRIPLFDPDDFLRRTMSVARLLLSKVGALFWLAAVLSGLKVAVDNWPVLQEQSQGILAPENLFLLYLGTVLVKTLHEFGHAYMCRRFGGEVHVMGVMFMIFTPMPYVDATSSWGFRRRYQRVLVGAAGMIVELFVAAVAAWIWRYTGQGVVHSLAYNILFVASVSTLVFNLNPLMRFDGYYILSDLLEIPNLSQRAMMQLRFWAEHYLLGVPKLEEPALTRREAAWLGVFGIASGIYRVIVSAGILLFVADRFLLLGVIMGVFCAIAWVVTPVVGLVRYLIESPRLARCRPRAVAVVSGFAVTLVILLQFVPFPSHFRAPGVLKSHEWAEVYNNSAGILEEVLVPPGATVVKDQPLLRLVNPELDLQFAAVQASLDEVRARIRQAMQDQIANLQPLTNRLESVQVALDRLTRDRASLTVRARQDGTWVAPQILTFRHRWLVRGSDLGLVVAPQGFQFLATVAQEDGDRLFSQAITNGQVRLHGQAGLVFPVSQVKTIPAERRNLPSAALGWAGGGNVPVAPDDPEGRRALEPFFEVWAEVGATEATLLHGRGGEIRFALQPEPLLPRWVRQLRQLMQKRYQI